jgi:hypothetical protein
MYLGKPPWGFKRYRIVIFDEFPAKMTQSIAIYACQFRSGSRKTMVNCLPNQPLKNGATGLTYSKNIEPKSLQNAIHSSNDNH